MVRAAGGSVEALHGAWLEAHRHELPHLADELDELDRRFYETLVAQGPESLLGSDG